MTQASRSWRLRLPVPRSLRQRSRRCWRPLTAICPGPCCFGICGPPSKCSWPMRSWTSRSSMSAQGRCSSSHWPITSPGPTRACHTARRAITARGWLESSSSTAPRRNGPRSFSAPRSTWCRMACPCPLRDPLLLAVVAGWFSAPPPALTPGSGWKTCWPPSVLPMAGCRLTRLRSQAESSPAVRTTPPACAPLQMGCPSNGSARCVTSPLSTSNWMRLSWFPSRRAVPTPHWKLWLRVWQ